MEPPQGPTAGGTVVTVDAPGAGFIEVSAGDNHSLGLTADGVVYAWGSNSAGQLGTAPDTVGTVIEGPVVVSALVGVPIIAVSAGTEFSLALAADGTVYSWGLNDAGQLGRTGDERTPALVAFPAGTPPISSIDAGSWKSAVALDGAGTAWAWGLNTYGQLGDGTTASSPEPVEVVFPETVSVSQIFAGTYFTAARTDDGRVWVWGRNNWGQLGNGSAQANTPHPVPQAVAFAPGVTVDTIAVGDGHVLALAGTDLYAWGRNAEGQLARPASGADLSPGLIDGLSGVTPAAELSAGFGNSIVRTESGDTYIWGWNSCGQIGNGEAGTCSTAQGSTPQVRTPFLLADPSGAPIETIRAGYMHVLATTGDGSAYGWGRNFDGQLGIGTFDGTVPTPTVLVAPVVTGVTFGGVAATDVQRISPTQVEATTPPHAAAVVDVVVTVADFEGTSAPSTTHPASFTFGSAPVVLAGPASGTAAVGERIVFRASGSADTPPTVTWEYLPKGATQWAPAPGDAVTTVDGNTADSTLTVTVTAALGGAQFRAVFTNPLGSASTDPASIGLPTLPATGFAADASVPAMLVMALGGGLLVMVGRRRSRAL
ncbi:RCC1 domain-containing protein [Agromyces larvae]|uniref:LPXTG cell wall anchor domain-containing protein n=1 Tax=Agromyces larvae TaxID=2929802 RepID=A0ABY4C0H3_9MICO|nr:IPT/TIG domain-containing protein [Agromyces larvae]UOE43451.1 hypothetical protein MTO99_14895 [Agromyces larvae]